MSGFRFLRLGLARSVVPLLTLLGCVAPVRGPDPGLQDVALRGDPQRRASMRLVLEGLDADERGNIRRALSRYERALQIDSGNPYAHLALARHFIEAGNAGNGLAHLDLARTLFEDRDVVSALLDAHLRGLRGSALRSEGRAREAQPLLDGAARVAPDLWGDGRLDARELRGGR